MTRNISKKIPRREANYSSLQEWIKKKKIPKKLNDGVSPCLIYTDRVILSTSTQPKMKLIT